MRKTAEAVSIGHPDKTADVQKVHQILQIDKIITTKSESSSINISCILL